MPGKLYFCLGLLLCCSMTNGYYYHPDCSVNLPNNPLFIPHNTDCNKFLKCANGKAYEEKCPFNLHWNREKFVCDQPANAKCEQHRAVARKQDTENCQNGQFYENKQDSTKYFKCVNGKMLVMYCANGFHWQPQIKRCNSLNTTILPKLKSGALHVECPVDDDYWDPIYIPYPEDCARFLKCSYGRAYVIQCPLGLYWNNEESRCNFAYLVKCDYDRGYKNVGLIVESDRTDMHREDNANIIDKTDGALKESEEGYAYDDSESLDDVDNSSEECTKICDSLSGNIELEISNDIEDSEINNVTKSGKGILTTSADDPVTFHQGASEVTSTTSSYNFQDIEAKTTNSDNYEPSKMSTKINSYTGFLTAASDKSTSVNILNLVTTTPTTSVDYTPTADIYVTSTNFITTSIDNEFNESSVWQTTIQVQTTNIDKVTTAAPNQFTYTTPVAITEEIITTTLMTAEKTNTITATTTTTTTTTTNTTAEEATEKTTETSLTTVEAVETEEMRESTTPIKVTNITTVNIEDVVIPAIHDTAVIEHNNDKDYTLPSKSQIELPRQKDETVLDILKVPKNKPALNFDSDKPNPRDPRLPYRAPQCIGDENRIKFAAKNCLQFYQCFEGYAYLLNCHDGYAFSADRSKCVIVRESNCK